MKIFQTTFESQNSFLPFLLHQPITGWFEQVGVIKRIHMLRAFVGAVFWNHRIRREADEVDASALGKHLLDFAFCSDCGSLAENSVSA